MPQGILKNLMFECTFRNKKLSVQIVVCKCVELSSGAIRNHIPELMYKLFSISGYTKR